MILRELRLAATGGAALLPLIFFLLVATLFPFAVGPDGPLLARTGGGALWMAALLAALLPVDRLVEPDRAAGVLDQLAVRGISEEGVALAKLAGHWLSFGPPLMLAALPAGGADEAAAGGAAAARAGPAGRHARARRADPGRRRADRRACARSGALAGLLMLPLAVPLLIFGAGLIERGNETGALQVARRGVAAAGRRRAVRGGRGDPGWARVSRDQRAKIAVGSSRPRASSRTAMSPHSTVPPRSPSAWLSNSPIASADMRTA